MSGHNVKLDDCRDGRSFGQYAQARGAEVKKVGSYLEITNNGQTIHVQDCNRAMPRQEQDFVYSLFCKIGLGAVVIGVAGLIIGAILAGVV